MLLIIICPLPLHVAYLCGHTQIAQYLIQHGADVYAVNSNGHTPYDDIDGDPNAIKYSEYLQKQKKNTSYSLQH